MSSIVIVRGTHTNEKVAYKLAELVTNYLTSKGIEAELVTESGFHALIKQPSKFPKTTIDSFLDYIENDYLALPASEQLIKKLNGSVIFDFHNTEEEFINKQKKAIEDMQIWCCNPNTEDKYRRYKGEDLRWSYNRLCNRQGILFHQVDPIYGPERKIETKNFFLIEIPAAYKSYSKRETEKYVQGTMYLIQLRPNLKRKFQEILWTNYLSGYASIASSRKKGYLSEKMIEILSNLILRITKIHDSK